ncbi:D-hexose-6-phosphate mutarotase [Pedosphaera parvula]|uniref:Putative glucose-6-phosphate 1-epimerase n=1 Tax=Pedosphaera parvula (strain Ellin514) TaxID=320771 RepID=B9XG88_PEDPL|nr:D-hexose-6-phosphate mutarotase [Pedosphaera parvula]EEF61250.1 Aldose 1-epimerase [Pedosphaera parvula Ellin514]
MATGKELEFKNKLDVSGRVCFLKGTGDLAKLSITTKWSSAEIYLHGAHITHFKKKNEEPLLFLSQESRFEEGQAIRGGIPIIFPWFGAKEGFPAHGFARVKDWVLKEIVMTREGSVELHFSLPDSEKPEGVPFDLDYTVSVGETLRLRLIVINKSPDREFVYEDCLHSYFNIGGVNSVGISGLKGVNYRDKVADFAEKTETAEIIKISSEVDRVYMDTLSTVEIHDPALRRKIRIEKENSTSTVVWNPWIAKAQALPDFGNEEYQKMVCVESGNLGKNKVSLAPGKSAVLKVEISSSSSL